LRLILCGKAIEVVVPSKKEAARISGSGDRTVLQKHIAGNPKIIIRNVPRRIHPRGESVHGRAKADGFNMVATSATQPSTFSWGQGGSIRLCQVEAACGKPGRRAVYVAPARGEDRGDLLKPKERLVFAGMSPTSLDLVALLAFDVLGLTSKASWGTRGGVRRALPSSGREQH